MPTTEAPPALRRGMRVRIEESALTGTLLETREGGLWYVRLEDGGKPLWLPGVWLSGLLHDFSDTDDGGEA